MSVTPPHFAFRLRKDANNYYSVINGVVTLSPAPTAPQFKTRFDIEGPANFNEEGIRWYRHPVYSGITTGYSESLKFVSDGMEIIERLFYQYDIEGDLQLDVWRVNYNTYLYEPFFIGDIDFTTFSPERGSVQISIKDGGAAAIIKAGESIPFELDMNNSAATYVRLSGVRLRGSYNYLLLSTDDLGGTVGATQFVPDQRSIGLYAAHTLDDGDFPVGTPQTQTNLSMKANYTDPTFINPAAYDNFILNPLQEMDIKVFLKQKWTVKYTLLGATNTSKLTIRLLITNEAHTAFTVTEDLYFDSVGVASGVTKTIDVDVQSTQHTITARQSVYVTFSITNGNSEVTFQQGSLKIQSEFQLTPSSAPVLRYKDAMAQLIDKLMESRYTFRSDFLSDPTLKVVDNYPYNTVMFPGDAARGLQGSKMAINLVDSYKDADCRWSMGLGTEGEVVRMEPIAHFYDNDSEIAHFTEVSDFRALPDLEKRGNVLNIGMEDIKYDTLNGKNEVNGTWVWKLPFPRRAKREIDMVSPFRWDPVGIESMRANLSQKPTTDNKADREVFVTSIDTTYTVNDGSMGDPNVIPLFATVYNQYRPNNTTNTTGVLFPNTYYNVDLTQKRNMLRNASKLAMYCYKRDGEKITFQTFEKNQELISDLGSGPIVEKADIILPFDTPPIYLPMLLVFRAVVPVDFNLTMLSNPYGVIRVSWNGIDYRGFVNKAGLVDAENSTFEFELQATRDNDFSKLSYNY